MASEYAKSAVATAMSELQRVIDVPCSAIISRHFERAIDAALRDQRQADLDAVRRAPLSTNDRAWARAAIEAAEVKAK